VSHRGKLLLKIFSAIVTILGLLAGGLFWELQTSRIQARYFSKWAAKFEYTLEDGISSRIAFPHEGPEDLRRGYTRIPEFATALRDQGFYIEKQTRFSPELIKWAGGGMPPPYTEKTQSGLHLLDRRGRPLYSSPYPHAVYPAYDSIPFEVVNTLLFIENRDLLDSSSPYANPALEWARFGKAISEQTKKKLGLPANAAGGSTLATQIEKYRHSGEGRTSTPREKLEQMLSASLRAYRFGEQTLRTRKDIVLQYINTVPLAAIAGYGEVNGLGDGLAAWYRTPLDSFNLHMKSADKDTDWTRRGYEYRKTLNLFIAHRRPSDYLLDRPEALNALGDSYVRLLGEEGILSPKLRDAALAARPLLAVRAEMGPLPDFSERKAVNAIRLRLARMLGMGKLYDLDRLDVTASTTLDGTAQDGVGKTLKRLSDDPAFLDSTGLRGFRLLDKGDPAKVIYSFTLYETSGSRNLLRVQADNYDRPLDINEQVKLDLGSTAKLRTLVHYLEILSGLHQRWAGISSSSLRDTAATAHDALSQWSARFLMESPDTSLHAMLMAAMERKYSANPREVFFTGGGQQTFDNFDPDDNHKTLTVRQALRNSVNLVFIRMMRDLVEFHIADGPVSKAMVFDSGDTPARRQYLEKFAENEGAVFLERFFRKYQSLSSEQAVETFFQGLVRAGPRGLASAYHYVYPHATEKDFSHFVHETVGDSLISETSLENLFAHTTAHTEWMLADYGFVTGVHPLELWLVGYLSTHKQSTWNEVRTAAHQPMLETYTWLFRSSRRQAQDQRIRSIMEMEAFTEIHRAWQQLGYPFSSLVPSLGTAIGSSADRPNALAGLMGILLNDGKRYPSGMVRRLHFAAGTPYETIFASGDTPPDQLLSPEICGVVREALLDVVENGTAARGRGAFNLPDGTPIALGGKTGTGDQRYETYGRGGQLIESRVVNRTATFVFFLGDRFFGTLTAHVEGAQAANYGFTSALPVKVLTLLKTQLMPLLQRPISTVEF